MWLRAQCVGTPRRKRGGRGEPSRTAAFLRRSRSGCQPSRAASRSDRTRLMRRSAEATSSLVDSLASQALSIPRVTGLVDPSLLLGARRSLLELTGASCALHRSHDCRSGRALAVVINGTRRRLVFATHACVRTGCPHPIDLANADLPTQPELHYAVRSRWSNPERKRTSL